jgi:hydroxymethylglutaryl-CoA reductase (NADPH)
MSKIASIPMQSIGPLHIIGQAFDENVLVPLATFETPLWPSTQRGARLSRLCGGIQTTIIHDGMTRSIVVEAPSATEAHTISLAILQNQKKIAELASQSSRFTRLQNIYTQIIGNLLYLRFEFFTGDAAGHNMATQASQHILNWLLHTYSQLSYVSISSNLCTDKKVSAINGILGRGKQVIAEITVPADVCQQVLRTTPEQIVALHIKKNLLGSIAAGSLRSANAHFANILLAFYLATGQDAANIVEGSQGIVHANVNAQQQLYFSVTLPNIIVGSLGNGKDLPFVQDNLKLMRCTESRAPGENANRLAMIAAATVLCGEISLLAAQTHQGELMRSHLTLERRKKQEKYHADIRN